MNVGASHVIYVIFSHSFTGMREFLRMSRFMSDQTLLFACVLHVEWLDPIKAILLDR